MLRGVNTAVFETTWREKAFKDRIQVAATVSRMRAGRRGQKSVSHGRRQRSSRAKRPTSRLTIGIVFVRTLICLVLRGTDENVDRGCGSCATRRKVRGSRYRTLLSRGAERTPCHDAVCERAAAAIDLVIIESYRFTKMPNMPCPGSMAHSLYEATMS